jgi:2-polyprenyl-6-methoxyphenol hydroxylase-like FAD-dependent oxidoreductase
MFVHRFGWPNYIISRPVLLNILLSLIPREKIHLSKRVLSQYETGDGVIIRTSDKKMHHGNILVGADGAYSGVRQSLYEYLNRKELLPPSDKLPLKYSSICLVGQTRPLDEDIYQHINDEVCRYEAVINDKKPIFVGYDSL